MGERMCEREWLPASVSADPDIPEAACGGGETSPNAGWRVASGSRRQRQGVWVARPPASCCCAHSCSCSRGGPCSSHPIQVPPGGWAGLGSKAVERPRGLLCLGRGAGRRQVGRHPPESQTQVASPRPGGPVQREVGREGQPLRGVQEPGFCCPARGKRGGRGTSRPAPHPWRGAG